MRFYAKTAAVLEEGREVTKTVKCKIMRPVSFPEVMDVYDFCTPKLQEALKANRDRHGDEILGDLKKTDATVETGASAAAEAMDEVTPHLAIDRKNVDAISVHRSTRSRGYRFLTQRN